MKNLTLSSPSYSPESNGMAEAFVKTFKRDYVSLDKLENMHDVSSKLSRWFDDYNENATPSRIENDVTTSIYKGCKREIGGPD